MCYSRSVSELLSFGISEITRGLRRKGYTLHKIDLKFLPDAKLNYIEIPWVWTTTSGGYYNRTEKKYSVKAFIRKDFSGLYLEIKYTLTRQLPSGEISNNICTRYDLVRRESNLKPGTYRYYFKDPYSTLDPEGGLCTRLYLIPELGEFVPRSVLKSWGVLYSQQRKGHKDRYYYPRGKKWGETSTRYRKTHYRGKETPFWRKYQEIQEERDYRLLEIEVSMGCGHGIIPPEVERDILLDYCKHTGRKTFPSPLSLYTQTRGYRPRRR